MAYLKVDNIANNSRDFVAPRSLNNTGKSVIREARIEDIHGILGLYQRVASIPGGLARLRDEVTEDYVESFVGKAIARGCIYVDAVDEPGHNNIKAEIHAYSPALYCFSHQLSDLTIAVDPQSQGSGLGRRIFETFMTRVQETMPGITRIELIARESNRRAIEFYQSLGFVIEGRFENRIKNIDGSFEADIPMAWTLPHALGPDR